MPSPSTEPQGRPRGNTAGYETRDANAKWIFGVIFALLLTGAGVHLVVSWRMKELQQAPQPTDRWARAGVTSNAWAGETGRSIPRLQVSPSADLKDFRAREALELSTYGWVDRTAGIVRIPIERAMELALRRGFPTSSGTNGLKLGPSSYELQLQRPAKAAQRSEGSR